MLTNHPRIRLGLYLVSIAVSVVAPFVAISSPEYGAAAVTSAAILSTAAGVTAAANTPKAADRE